MRPSVYILIPLLLLFMLLVDVYTYRGIKPLLEKIKYSFLRRSLRILFWGISLVIFVCFGLYMLGVKPVKQADVSMYRGYLVASFFLFYIPKFVFILFVFLKDIQLAVTAVVAWFKQRTTSEAPSIRGNKTIKRSEFLYKMGLGVAAIPFVSILYGVTLGKFDYRLMHEKIRFKHLPKSFKGLKIVQISDLHLGSFNKNFEPVAKAVELINAQEPDLILFTGDIVNNLAEETIGWAPVLAKMKAKIGKYSVLGNHDYGDYSKWESTEAKANNLADIKQFHKQMGFRLLLNETETITINKEEIALIGIENWGKPPFPQYGDLLKASKPANHQAFKLLMSHDPSHWDEEVIKSTDIDLTFAGHTHGMQFGFEYAGIKWSPIKYKYPRWGGLYREENQYLYVNRGFGFIGFPGRIGMPPEITVVELA